jgi:hypothetical protein
MLTTHVEGCLLIVVWVVTYYLMMVNVLPKSASSNTQKMKGKRKMRKHGFTVVMVIVGIITFLTGVLSAGEVTPTLESRLQAAIKAGNAREAADWAAAINSIKQARLADESTKMVQKHNKLFTTYENVFKSIPVVLDGFCSLLSAGGEDKELIELVQLVKLMGVLPERPLQASEISKVTDTIIRFEKKQITTELEKM